MRPTNFCAGSIDTAEGSFDSPLTLSCTAGITNVICIRMNSLFLAPQRSSLRYNVHYKSAAATLQHCHSLWGFMRGVSGVLNAFLDVRIRIGADAQGNLFPPYWMNFQRFSERPLTPPSLVSGKYVVIFSQKFMAKIFFVIQKISNGIVWIRNAIPPSPSEILRNFIIFWRYSILLIPFCMGGTFVLKLINIIVSKFVKVPDVSVWQVPSKVTINDETI